MKAYVISLATYLDEINDPVCRDLAKNANAHFVVETEGSFLLIDKVNFYPWPTGGAPKRRVYIESLRDIIKDSTYSSVVAELARIFNMPLTLSDDNTVFCEGSVVESIEVDHLGEALNLIAELLAHSEDEFTSAQVAEALDVLHKLYEND